MKLTLAEQTWLDDYRQALSKQFPELVEEMVVFGSKARGEAGPESDLDVLVIVREGDRGLKRAIRHLAHELAAVSDAVPSIMVYTREEWIRRERNASPFYQAVTRDGVRVA